MGLHSGQTTQVSLHPAPPGHGRRLQRQDLPGTPPLHLSPDRVQPSALCTQVVQGEVCAQTVEHLLAALGARGLTDVLIELDGPEVPLLDGSARDWVEAIDEAGGLARESLLTQDRHLCRNPSGFMREMPLSLLSQRPICNLVTVLTLAPLPSANNGKPGPPNGKTLIKRLPPLVPLD